MRKDAGLTQAELARKIGTTQSVIARLEDAEYTALAHNAGALCYGLRRGPQAPRRKEAKFRPRSSTGLVAVGTAELLAGPRR